MVTIVKMLHILYETIKLGGFCTISILVRGNDNITGEELFEGTSKSVEGFGAEWVFKKAITDKMNIGIHVQDNDDSTSSKALLSNVPHCRIILCSGHIARNHEKHLKSQIKKFQKTYPDIATVKCHCIKDDIGCFTNSFVKSARINFSAIVKSVGCDQQAFIDRLHSLAKYHAKNVHKWDGGKCFFHDLTVCDFGKCKKSDITCQGKPYITKNVLNCPFHSLAYEIACETVIAKSKTIHKELGCCHTSVIESSQCIAAVQNKKFKSSEF
uniref:MULE transposase domain-containing protein n=1 Tax=Amphimedon queenslandica TaxID=400682 RepID=A0A1X7UMQ9_AMPQE